MISKLHFFNLSCCENFLLFEIFPLVLHGDTYCLFEDNLADHIFRITKTF
jgi:hypothetical protein